jgi:hypothetical protein
MKTGITSLLLLIPLLISCSDESCDPCATPTDNRIPFELNFLEYSDNNYFIDDVYADTSSDLNIFNNYYGNFPPGTNIQYSVKNIQVYITTNQLGQNYAFFANAYIDLPARTYIENYPDSLRDFWSFIPIAGQRESGRFKLLNSGGDYLFNPFTGQISFLHPLNEQDIVAVAYSTESDSIYGEFFSDLIRNQDSVAVLKLVKPRNLQPAYRKAWKLKMRNLYKIIAYPGEIKDVDLDIYLRRANGSETNSINNKRLLELFGFDKFDESGNQSPDGKFDDLIGYNYESETAEIIFPVIQPFGENIPPDLNEYKYHWIYDTVKTYLSLPDNYFVIKGKYRPR